MDSVICGGLTTLKGYGIEQNRVKRLTHDKYPKKYGTKPNDKQHKASPVWFSCMGSLIRIQFCDTRNRKVSGPSIVSLKIITLKSKKMNESWTEIQHEIFVMKVGRFR